MKSDTYDCCICHGLNYSTHLTCQYCGAYPANYSPIQKTARITEDGTILEIVVAYGAVRQDRGYSRRVNLKTVELDYYASE